MHWLSLIIVPIAVNLDNVMIGFSYGLKRKRLSLLLNGGMTLIIMLGTLISIACGAWFLTFLSPVFMNAAGGVLIMIVGAFPLYQYFFKKDTDHVPPSQNGLSNVSVREALITAAFLAANNFAAGVGSGATGLSPLILVLFTGIVSAIFLKLGEYFGCCCFRISSIQSANLIAGLLLVFIGLYETFF